MESPNFTLGLAMNVDESSMDGTSPMSDLARNLSVLSTHKPASPCGISWSSPYPTSYKLCPVTSDDSPFAVDSPTFQEGVLRGVPSKSRQRKYDTSFNLRKPAIKKLYAQDKENYCNSPKKTSNAVFKRKLNSETSESDFSGSSQESGYCEEIVKHTTFQLSLEENTSIQGSMFTDEEVDDEEGFFSMDKFEDDDDVPTSVSQLLTNPLRESVNGCFKPTCLNTRDVTRKAKPPMRRCLSVLTSNFSPSFDTDTVNIEIASGAFQSEPSISPEKASFKRPEPVDIFTPLQIKRRKSSPNVVPLVCKPILQRSYSETATTIMNAVQKSDQNPDFIGDFTRSFTLPMIDGKHQDLKTIKGETLVRLLKGEFRDVKDFKVIDCRYPYEYEGGHIAGAINIFTKEDLNSALLVGAELPKVEHQSLAVFHCEFSSERAPKLLRFLRNEDRQLNKDGYPRLYHPEIYLLEGGYKAFFEEFKEFCSPQGYKPMVHKDHTRELCEFRAKSKSFGNDTRMRPRLRSNLKF